MILLNWLNAFRDRIRQPLARVRSLRPTGTRSLPPASRSSGRHRRPSDIEVLEDRALLAATVDVVGANLVVTDSSGNTADVLTFTANGTNLTITDNSGNAIDLLNSLNGGTGDGTSSVTVALSSFSGGTLDVNTLAGNDTINIGALTLLANQSLDVDGGTGTINVTAAISVTGTGTVTLDATKTVDIDANISVVNGNLTISGNTSGTTVGNFIGVDVNNSTLQTTGTGNITITGRGAKNSQANSAQVGVRLIGGASIKSTATGASAGTITITGTGGDGTSDNEGLRMVNNTTDITSVDGDISITGTGGAGSSSSTGVRLNGIETISSTGTGANAASITIIATGGGASGSTRGIRLEGSTTDVTSIDGNITVNGTSGANGGGDSIGVKFTTDATIQTTSGAIDVTGTSLVASAHGIALSDTGGGRLISLGAGTINLTGTGTGATKSDLKAGADSIIGGASATGAITINANTIDLVGTTNIESTGSLTITPRTASTTIGLGGGAGTLNLDDTELGFLANGFSSITIGDAAAGTGAVGVNSSTFNDNVTIVGGAIKLTGLLNAGTNDVFLNSRTSSILDSVSGNSIAGAGVRLNSVGRITDFGNNTGGWLDLTATTVAAQSTGDFVRLRSTGNLTVGTVNGLSGILADSIVNLKSDADVSVSATNITTTGDSVTITADADGNGSGDVVTTTGTAANQIVSKDSYTSTNLLANVNFKQAYAVGANLVFAFSSRAGAGDNSFTVTDSDGNTYTRIIDQDQTNGFTASAIFTTTVGGDEISTSDTFTISTTGTSTNNSGLVIYQLDGIAVSDTSSTPGPTPIAETANASNGVAIHVLGSGGGSKTLSSHTFDLDLENNVSAQRSYVFSAIATGPTTTNTVSFTPTSGQYSSVMAVFGGGSAGGISTSGGAVTISGAAVTMGGSISAGAGNVAITATSTDVTVTGNITKSAGADATLTIRANDDIVFSGGADVTSTSNKLNVVLNSDRDASGAGGIALGSGSVITSNGGNIMLGGGSDPSSTATVGTVDSSNHGVDLNGSSLISASVTAGPATTL